METLNFHATEEGMGCGTDLSFYLLHVPDPFYLENYLSPSEPRILYFSHPARPARRMHDSSYGRDAARLLSIVDKIRANNTPRQEASIRNLISSLKAPVARLRDGEVAELCEDPEKNLESFIALHYIRLPWNAVRLHLEERGRNRGYFICFGWNPVSDELYYSGPDFVMNRTEEERDRLRESAPLDRGVPEDIIQTKANCGPSALGAYLNISCAKAIELLPYWQEHGHVPIKPLLEGLSKHQTPHQSLKLRSKTESPSEAFGKNKAGLAFIQFTGPWDGHWSQEYLHLHWIAFDHGRVYDVNSLNSDDTRGAWTSEAQWLGQVIPALIPPKGTGHYIKNILIPR